MSYLAVTARFVGGPADGQIRAVPSWEGIPVNMYLDVYEPGYSPFRPPLIDSPTTKSVTYFRSNLPNKAGVWIYTVEHDKTF